MAEKITYSRETERTADAGYHKAVGDQYFRRDRPVFCDRFCGFRFYHSRILIGIISSSLAFAATAPLRKIGCSPFLHGEKSI